MLASRRSLTLSRPPSARSSCRRGSCQQREDAAHALRQHAALSRPPSARSGPRGRREPRDVSADNARTHQPRAVIDSLVGDPSQEFGRHAKRQTARHRISRHLPKASLQLITTCHFQRVTHFDEAVTRCFKSLFESTTISSPFGLELVMYIFLRRAEKCFMPMNMFVCSAENLSDRQKSTQSIQVFQWQKRHTSSCA